MNLVLSNAKDYDDIGLTKFGKKRIKEMILPALSGTQCGYYTLIIMQLYNESEKRLAHSACSAL